ncbi:L-alanine-DL-glutamate epimerase [Tranquillimonas rosea]|uniref:L-alanine-DL-glutamate epimerase n=1 Tax=Tranquillimonas rosea TaxID=641238 RepID=A0A1H9X8T4_9RHOB|nr:mandelate racemase/muconate lactonizing enzyme family protein [Tranquillimonas rosea]SES42596.1 L-alanine-DL-glutamate epimerase [Tranquillimonas rosea]
MRVIGLETIQIEEFSNLVWVRLHTDEGLVGLGETFRNPEAVVAYVHETCAPTVIGQDPMQRTALSHALRHEVGNRFQGFPTRSIEIRGNSAIDIALWDLWGQALGQSITTLLGGAVHERLRLYNTCANSNYNNQVRTGYDSQIFSRDQAAPADISRNEDLLMQVYDPARLARELLDEGITAMKVWPFDVHARESRGQTISARQMKDALWVLEEIRREAGDRMDILIEYHGLWHLPAALEIARATEEYGIFWQEDPIKLDNPDDLQRYAEVSRTRLAGSENLGTLPWYRDMFGRGAIDVANFDMAWTGGLTEGQRIAHLALAHDRTIAPHDCTGPVTLLANLQLMAAMPNALMAETVRSHLDGFYRDVMTDVPKVADGYIHPTTGPGLGAGLNQTVLSRPDLTRRASGRTCD